MNDHSMHQVQRMTLPTLLGQVILIMAVALMGGCVSSLETGSNLGVENARMVLPELKVAVAQPLVVRI